MFRSHLDEICLFEHARLLIDLTFRAKNRRSYFYTISRASQPAGTRIVLSGSSSLLELQNLVFAMLKAAAALHRGACVKLCLIPLFDYV